MMKVSISMKNSIKLWLLGALLSASSSLLASGWVTVLKNSPAEYFDDEDLRMFLAAAGTALNAEGSPKQVTWTNPATGSGGSFLELSRSTGAAGTPCKRLRVSTYAKKHAVKSGTYTLCKSTQGRWQFSASR